MKELVFHFGKQKNLVGIITDPAPAAGNRNNPAIIILNSGLLHRIGPNRLYVKLARKLASNGFLAFRFDLSGVGDSKLRRDHLPFELSSLIETQEAMDFLTLTRNVEKFILTGICSGADASFQTACNDPRVIGIAPIDFYTRPSANYFLNYYTRRLLNFRSWGRFLAGKSGFWGSLVKTLITISLFQTTGSSSKGGEDSQITAKEQIIANIPLLIQRGIHLYFIYTSGSPGYYNYRKILRKELRHSSSEVNIQIEHLHNTDHGFTPLSSQEKLIRLISDWVQKIKLHSPSSPLER